MGRAQRHPSWAARSFDGFHFARPILQAIAFAAIARQDGRHNTATGATMSTMMKLGLFVEGTGHHVAAWRDPDVDPHGRQTLKQYVDIARLAERGKFDLLFMADTNATFGPDDVETWTRTTQASRLEPITLLGALAAVTERIGLVATATTTYFEPFHVARFFASIDQISGGRAGWNLVTSLAVAEAYNFGRESPPHHGDRYARAREFAKVVLGLWDSFEDGAVIADKDSGIYFDREKLHFLNHKGKHFAVRGPVTVHRSSQGHPVIVQAGQSDDGRDLAADTAEITCRRYCRRNWRSRIGRRTSAAICRAYRSTDRCPIRPPTSSKRAASKSW